MQTEVINNKKYLTTIYRGTEYCLTELCGDWSLSTRRVGLGRHHVGGHKYFETLNDVAKNCKAFGSVENLINAFYCVNIAQ